VSGVQQPDETLFEDWQELKSSLLFSIGFKYYFKKKEL